MDSPDTAGGLNRLTARQRECLALAAQHRTSKEIGRRLQISPKTVDRHIEEAVRKLDVTDRAAAVRLLIEVEAGVGAPQPVVSEAFYDYGDNPHGERAPVFEAALAGHGSAREGESSHGQAPADVHLDRRSGRPGDPGRNLAAEEGDVLVAGAAEAGLGHFIAGRAPGGNHQYGNPPWGIAPIRGWAPEPARRLGWVAVIAAGLALAAGALIGSYDLMSALHRIAAGPTA